MSFDELAKSTDDAIVDVIRHEHAQTKAYVLSQLPEEKAGAALSRMKIDEAADVLLRIKNMNDTRKWATDAVKAELDKEIASQEGTGGLKYATKVINTIDPNYLKQIILAIDNDRPEDGEELRDGISQEKIDDMNLTGEKYELS